MIIVSSEFCESYQQIGEPAGGCGETPTWSCGQDSWQTGPPEAWALHVTMWPTLANIFAQSEHVPFNITALHLSEVIHLYLVRQLHTFCYVLQQSRESYILISSSICPMGSFIHLNSIWGEVNSAIIIQRVQSCLKLRFFSHRLDPNYGWDTLVFMETVSLRCWAFCPLQCLADFHNYKRNARNGNHLSFFPEMSMFLWYTFLKFQLIM